MIVAVWRKTCRRRGKRGRKKHKGIQCNVKADPSAFRHGHFHFHHAKVFSNHFSRHRGDRHRGKEDGLREERVVEVK